MWVLFSASAICFQFLLWPMTLDLLFSQSHFFLTESIVFILFLQLWSVISSFHFLSSKLFNSVFDYIYLGVHKFSGNPTHLRLCKITVSSQRCWPEVIITVLFCSTFLLFERSNLVFYNRGWISKYSNFSFLTCLNSWYDCTLMLHELKKIYPKWLIAPTTRLGTRPTGMRLPSSKFTETRARIARPQR